MANWNNNPAYPQGSHPTQFVPPKQKTHTKLWLFGLVAAFVLGLGIGAAAFSNPATDAVANEQPSATSTTTTTPKAAPAAKPTRKAEKPKSVAETFGNGTFIVGKDIKPGTYKSASSDTCYWARLRSLEGDLNSIIANSVSTGPQVVTIKAKDKAFKSQLCETWFLVP